MSDINHLQEAKNHIDTAQELHMQGSTTNYKEHEGLAKAHALIAIAEQLEKMNNKNDINTRWHE